MRKSNWKEGERKVGRGEQSFFGEGRSAMPRCRSLVTLFDRQKSVAYLTRSARLKVCKCFPARVAISSSAIVVELGGWDHVLDDCGGYRARHFALENRRTKEIDGMFTLRSRMGLLRLFMVVWNALENVVGGECCGKV